MLNFFNKGIILDVFNKTLQTFLLKETIFNIMMSKYCFANKIKRNVKRNLTSFELFRNYKKMQQDIINFDLISCNFCLVFTSPELFGKYKKKQQNIMNLEIISCSFWLDMNNLIISSLNNSLKWNSLALKCSFRFPN